MTTGMVVGNEGTPVGSPEIRLEFRLEIRLEKERRMLPSDTIIYIKMSFSFSYMDKHLAFPIQ